MKTSELKKIVESNRFEFQQTSDKDILIEDGLGLLMRTIDCVAIVIGESRIIKTIGAKNVLKALLDYTVTPLEEREEEKKYRLILPNEFYESFIYLNKAKDISKYQFMGKVETPNYQTIFTQKEIDAMPFDTNFFIKDEV